MASKVVRCHSQLKVRDIDNGDDMSQHVSHDDSTPRTKPASRPYIEYPS